LSPTFKKNCEPPELGRPVLAIESVPGLFESLEIFSSWMLPPLVRDSISPVARFLNVPSGGPPVPEREDFGSLLWGHPNCFVLGAGEGRVRAHTGGRAGGGRHQNCFWKVRGGKGVRLYGGGGAIQLGSLPMPERADFGSLLCGQPN
jgi:hypothetical protein